jgi:hypothetical protein
VKYLSIAAFGFATLAAMSFQWILDGDVPARAVRRVLIGAGVLAAITYIAIAWVLLAPAVPIRGFFELAVWAKVPAPIQGAEFLLYRARPLFTSLLLKLISTSFLLWVAASTRRERRLALAVFSAFAVIDLLAANSDVNPTTDPRCSRNRRGSRHCRATCTSASTSAVASRATSTRPTMMRRSTRGTWTSTRSRNSATSLSANTCSAIRLPRARVDVLRSAGVVAGGLRAHDLALQDSSREARLRFLRRVGVRYVILPQPPYPGATPLARMEADRSDVSL